MHAELPFIAPPPFGGKAALFDRFGVDAPRMLTQRPLVDSIAQHLKELLFVRSCGKRSVLYPLSGATLSLPCAFGFPDFLFQEITQPHKGHAWQRMIEKIIAHFEPRLMNPKVTFIPQDFCGQTLSIEIRGSVLIDHQTHAINFPLVMGY